MHRHNDIPFDDMSRTTVGEEGVVVCFCSGANCVLGGCFDLRGGHRPPRNDSASTSSRRCSGSAFVMPAFIPGVASPRLFGVCLIFFSSPSGVFLLSLWVGWVPLAAFSSSPLFLWRFSFLWVVGVPLLRFPGVFPLVSRVGRGACFPVAFSCYLLHLASFSSRSKLGKDGLPTRNPPGPPRPFPWRVCPDLSPAGSRRVDAPRSRAGG